MRRKLLTPADEEAVAIRFVIGEREERLGVLVAADFCSETEAREEVPDDANAIAVEVEGDVAFIFEAVVVGID
jgi:hypothetical protein